jgi:hypothetical protein
VCVLGWEGGGGGHNLSLVQVSVSNCPGGSHISQNYGTGLSFEGFGNCSGPGVVGGQISLRAIGDPTILISTGRKMLLRRVRISQHSQGCMHLQVLVSHSCLATRCGIIWLMERRCNIHKKASKQGPQFTNSGILQILEMPRHNPSKPGHQLSQESYWPAVLIAIKQNLFKMHGRTTMKNPIYMHSIWRAVLMGNL